MRCKNSWTFSQILSPEPRRKLNPASQAKVPKTRASNRTQRCSMSEHRRLRTVGHLHPEHGSASVLTGQPIAATPVSRLPQIKFSRENGVLARSLAHSSLYINLAHTHADKMHTWLLEKLFTRSTPFLDHQVGFIFLV